MRSYVTLSFFPTVIPRLYKGKDGTEEGVGRLYIGIPNNQIEL